MRSQSDQSSIKQAALATTREFLNENLLAGSKCGINTAFRVVSFAFPNRDQNNLISKIRNTRLKACWQSSAGAKLPPFLNMMSGVSSYLSILYPLIEEYFLLVNFDLFHNLDCLSVRRLLEFNDFLYGFRLLGLSGSLRFRHSVCFQNNQSNC